MASLVERLRVVAQCADYPGRYVIGGDQLALADVEEAADRITALEAMCETLAGALKPFARAKHYSAELNKLKPEARTKPRDFVVSDEFKDAAQALTQYRAMKEKNDDH